MILSLGFVASSLGAEALGGVMILATVGLFVYFFYEYGYKYALEQFLGIFIRALDGSNFTAYVSPSEVHDLKSLDLRRELEELYAAGSRKLNWSFIKHEFEFKGFAVAAHVGELMSLSRFRKGWVTLFGFLRRTRVADVEAVEVWHDVIMYEPELSKFDRLRVALHLLEAPDKFDYEYIPYLYVYGSDVQARDIRNRFMGLYSEFKDAASFEKALELVRQESVHVFSTGHREKEAVLEQKVEDQRDVILSKVRNTLVDKTPEIEGERGINVDWKKWGKRFLIFFLVLVAVYAAYWFVFVYLGVSLPPPSSPYGNETSRTGITTITRTVTSSGTLP